jgi:hypothetical protein
MLPFSDPKNKPITEKEYDAFTQKYQLDLPEVYKQIMLQSNGGFPKRPCFEEDSIYITPIAHEDFTMPKLLETSGIDYLGLGLYPFCDGAGGVSYCIGLDQSKYHQIFKIDETGVYNEVAPSLEAFIQSLEEDHNERISFATAHPFKENQSLFRRIFGRLFR